MEKKKAHSERYFTDARDYWWHSDYLGLLAKRFQVAQARSILEVGVGQGHFARAWMPHFSKGYTFTGLDREERSLQIAREKTAAFCLENGHDGQISFVKGAAENLPFADNSFDMVMCQTVLIHLPNPTIGFQEMVRVTKPGGLVLAVEPNNLAGLQRLASAGPRVDLQRQLAVTRFHLRAVHGKMVLGHGWNDFGVHLPKLFSSLNDVQYYNNDRAWVFAPPYAEPQQAAALFDLERDVNEGVYGWERSEVREYYLAAGGSEEEFTSDYNTLLQIQREEFELCKRGEWTELVAFAGLIAGGRKPG